jgi:hypothetical protein
MAVSIGRAASEPSGEDGERFDDAVTDGTFGSFDGGGSFSICLRWATTASRAGAGWSSGRFGFRAFQSGGDEDRNLTEVGSLARDKPILLLIETLGHRRPRRFGVAGEKVRERRPFKRFGHGRRGEHLREMKTQERIGPNRRGNTWRMVVRIPMRLKSLEGSRQGPPVEGRSFGSDIPAGHGHWPDGYPRTGASRHRGGQPLVDERGKRPGTGSTTSRGTGPSRGGAGRLGGANL